MIPISKAITTTTVMDNDTETKTGMMCTVENTVIASMQSICCMRDGPF